MATKEKKPKAEKFASLADAGLETFVSRTIHRSDIHGAEYNPRVITDEEKGKLKNALKRHGLVAPITWNKRTSKIVGGHQRITIMDSLMKTSDYTLTVAEIDVPVSREKELNIVLNNNHAMGSWDMAGLKSMFEDVEVTIEGAGFDMSDMIGLFGDSAFDERPDDLKELADKLGSMTDSYTAVQRANKAKSSREFFLVFVFPDSDHVDALLRAYNLQENRYQNGRHLMKLLRVPEPGKELDED